MFKKRNSLFLSCFRRVWSLVGTSGPGAGSQTAFRDAAAHWWFWFFINYHQIYSLMHICQPQAKHDSFCLSSGRDGAKVKLSSIHQSFFRLCDDQYSQQHLRAFSLGYFRMSLGGSSRSFQLGPDYIKCQKLDKHAHKKMQWRREHQAHSRILAVALYDSSIFLLSDNSVTSRATKHRARRLQQQWAHPPLLLPPPLLSSPKKRSPSSSSLQICLLTVFRTLCAAVQPDRRLSALKRNKWSHFGLTAGFYCLRLQPCQGLFVTENERRHIYIATISHVRTTRTQADALFGKA